MTQIAEHIYKSFDLPYERVMPEQTARWDYARVDKELADKVRALPAHECVREADKELVEANVEYVIELTGDDEYVEKIVAQLPFAQYGSNYERVAAYAKQNEEECNHCTQGGAQATRMLQGGGRVHVGSRISLRRCYAGPEGNAFVQRQNWRYHSISGCFLWSSIRVIIKRFAFL